MLRVVATIQASECFDKNQKVTGNDITKKLISRLSSIQRLFNIISSTLTIVRGAYMK